MKWNEVVRIFQTTNGIDKKKFRILIGGTKPILEMICNSKEQQHSFSCMRDLRFNHDEINKDKDRQTL